MRVEINKAEQQAKPSILNIMRQNCLHFVHEREQWEVFMFLTTLKAQK